jgi:hypothetical protein
MPICSDELAEAGETRTSASSVKLSQISVPLKTPRKKKVIKLIITFG